MGLFDRLLGREQFSQWSIADKAFAGWWLGTDDASEVVTPATVIGLSAVRRSLQILCTIAGLPLKSYQRHEDGERSSISTVFDNPYPGIDGMTPFAWVETIVIHLALWDRAFLWHDDVAADGTVTVYRPIHPDVIQKVYRNANGRRQFDYKDENNETRTVGSEQITYISGPSHDGTTVPAGLYAARAIFSAAISGDRGAQGTLRRSIRLGGLVTPADGEEDFDTEEGKAILEYLRANVVGREHSGDIAVINRKLNLKQWSQNNQDMQWIETRKDVLADIERYFGMPPHLMADTEKQTSWGTGVAEQNLSLARYTLRGYSDRIEQVLSMRLPEGQFCEFDYAGLLQGTPQQEIELLIQQMDAGMLTVDEVRKIRNLPPLTAAQKAQQALQRMPQPVTDQGAANE